MRSLSCVPSVKVSARILYDQGYIKLTDTKQSIAYELKLSGNKEGGMNIGSEVECGELKLRPSLCSTFEQSYAKHFSP